MNYVTDIASLRSREWRKVEGASEQEIASLRKVLPFEPPDEYLEFLRFSNGGEGELALDPLWFQLFEVAFALQLWQDQNYRNEYPDLYFFGSNGGGESIAFDMSQPEPWPIVMIDCIAGLESARRISLNIQSFIQKVGIRAEQ
jgi:hypothetical protein